MAEDLFTPAEVKVEITAPKHILKLGEVHGLLRAVDVLQGVPEGKRTPGFAYAMALLEAETHGARANLIAMNLGVVAKAGIDISTISGVSALGWTLICKPFAPGEEA